MNPSTITRHLVTALLLTIAILWLWPTVAHAQSTTTIRGMGLQPLIEESGNTQTLNIYGPGGVIIAQVATDSPAGGTPTTQTRYLLHDHLGSTRVVLDSSNQVLGSFDYSPFGETTPTGNVADVAYRYTGQEVNGALGTYNYHARHYDAGVGRFLGVDPARQFASSYVYVGNNPINATDVTGELTDDDVDFVSLHGLLELHQQIKEKIAVRLHSSELRVTRLARQLAIFENKNKAMSVEINKQAKKIAKMEETIAEVNDVLPKIIEQHDFVQPVITASRSDFKNLTGLDTDSLLAIESAGALDDHLQGRLGTILESFTLLFDIRDSLKERFENLNKLRADNEAQLGQVRQEQAAYEAQIIANNQRRSQLEIEWGPESEEQQRLQGIFSRASTEIESITLFLYKLDGF